MCMVMSLNNKMSTYNINSIGLLATLLICLYTTSAEVLDPNGPGASRGNFSCYSCNSFYSPSCADWFNNRTWEITPCKPEERMCRKIVQEAWYDDLWNIRYIRHCAMSGQVGYDEGRRCVDRVGTYRIKMRYCHCDNKDGCNTASSIKFSSIMILPGLIALRFLIG